LVSHTEENSGFILREMGIHWKQERELHNQICLKQIISAENVRRARVETGD
jgi:hypothetical protein